MSGSGTMRAAVMPGVGETFAIENIPVPKPGDSEVLVKVRSCGVCHTDLHVLKCEVKFPMPCVLGHEISGTVETAGRGVRNVEDGDRVVASFIMPCGYCPH